jgi:hypothetical protein
MTKEVKDALEVLNCVIDYESSAYGAYGEQGGEHLYKALALVENYILDLERKLIDAA